MKVEKEQLASSKWALTVEVDQTEAQSQVETELQKLQQESALPGFRKGKAPMSLIRQRFAKAIEADVMHKHLYDYYDQALKEAALPEPIAPPDIEIQKFEPGQPLVFKATVEVQPHIEVAGYEGLTVVRERVDVGEAEIDMQIERLREEQAVISDDPNPAGPESLIETDLQELDSGMLPVIGHKRENVLIDLGKGAPDLRGALTGIKSGESRNAMIPKPKTQPQEEQQFDRLQFSVKAVKRKELPEINDEFAKSLDPNLEGVAGLRDAIRKNLQMEIDGISYQRMSHLLVHQIVDNTRLDVPETMLNNYLNKFVADLKRRAQASGNQPIDEVVARERYRGSAQWDLRWYLIRKTIAQKEEQKITPEDVQQELERIAAATGKKLKIVQAAYDDERKRDQLEDDLMERKILQLLVSKARVIERTVSYEDFFKKSEGEHEH